MDLDPDAPAGEVLAAELLAERSAGRWAAVRFVVAGVFRAIFDDGGAPGPPLVSGFLAITRRDAGELIHRTDLFLQPSPGTEDARLLAHVRRQLDVLTVGEFLEQRGIAPPGHGSGG